MNVPRSSLASFFFLIAVFLALFVSGAALNLLGLNYSGNDSAGGLKIHPYVMFTLVAMFILLPKLTSDKRYRTPVVCSVLVLAVLLVKAASTGSKSMGFVVDTVLGGCWIAGVAPFMTERVVRRVLDLGLAFVIFECAMAVFEVVTRTQFIPIDTWYGSYFRATALQGHPLNNALILVTVSVALQLSRTTWISILAFLFTTAALSAFGARGALTVYLTLNALVFVRFGLRSPGRLALVLFGVPVIVAIVGWALWSGTLGERIANVGAFDNSSGVRLQSLEVLEYLDWKQMLIGADPDLIAKLMDRADVSVIENFVVGYVLMFGLVCTLLLFACIWICFRTLMREWNTATRRRLYVMLAALLLTAMTNNSLMTKTPALFLGFVFCWAAGRELERRRESASTARTGQAQERIDRPVRA